MQGAASTAPKELNRANCCAGTTLAPIRKKRPCEPQPEREATTINHCRGVSVQEPINVRGLSSPRRVTRQKHRAAATTEPKRSLIADESRSRGHHHEPADIDIAAMRRETRHQQHDFTLKQAAHGDQPVTVCLDQVAEVQQYVVRPSA